MPKAKFPYRDPPQSEIHQLCMEIQRGWSPAERNKRLVAKQPQRLEIPFVDTNYATIVVNKTHRSDYYED